MSCADLIIGLPAELSGEIVGRWLRVEEIARVDSAFCQAVARESLHHNVFASSSCILTKVSSPSVNGFKSIQMLNWVALRRIRAEHVSTNGKNFLISVEYLQMLGKHIKSIRLSENCVNSSASIVLIARYCANLRSVEISAFQVSDSLLQLLNACPQIESLKIYTRSPYPPYPTIEPKSSTLRVLTLDMDCGKVVGERILSMCVPESVQRLKISHDVCVSYWSRFTTLRSLDLAQCTPTRHILVQILDQCRSLVNLKVKPGRFFDSDLAEHMPPLRSLNIENGYVNSGLQFIGTGFVQKQKHTLEALLACGSFGLTGDAINLVLADCPNLLTLSFDGIQIVDFTLMGNLTTLITDCFGSDATWGLLQQHCRSLQYLHVIFTYVRAQDPTPMVEALSQMPALRRLYFAGVPSKHKQFYTHAANELRVLRPTLHMEENEVEGAWYDLFMLPI